MKAISKQRESVEHHRRHMIRRGWLSWLHWENLPWLEGVLVVLLKLTGLWARGRRNVLGFRVEPVDAAVANLPKAFDGYRILWLSDLHIDKNDGLAEAVIDAVERLDYDVCFLGGDYSFDHRLTDTATERMGRIVEVLCKKSAVYAIFGNHDQYAMGQALEARGVRMLVNDHAILACQGDRLAIVGVDDCHYYRADDLAAATDGLEDGVCKIFLCHSPEQYHQAAEAGMSLMLSGHTHAGQICLPNGFAPVTCATVPRRFIRGLWQHDILTGYTSRGVGASGVPVRFNCPGEITLLTLKAGD